MNLTFWLRDPNSNLIDLSSSMKLFPNYCIATLLLPMHGYGAGSHVGEWEMIVQGEADITPVPYHVMVVADDRVTSFSCLTDQTVCYAGAKPVISLGLKYRGTPVPVNQSVSITTIKRTLSPAELMAQ